MPLLATMTVFAKMPRDIATTAVAPIIGGNNLMPNHNLITAVYLKLLEWFAGFLVWLADTLESLFGVRVHDGILNAASRRLDACEEFGSASSSFQIANASVTTESDRFTSKSPSTKALDSSKETEDIAPPICDLSPGFGVMSYGTIEIKPFDPYDPEDPHSVYNGDPLNFDPVYHSDPFDNS